jgi:hypothetical protein
MPNNDSRPETSTCENASAPLSLPRENRSFQNHLLIQCICTIPMQDRYQMAVAETRHSRIPWMPNETCKCHGTEWVCGMCHGHKWVLGGKGADPCPACTVVVDNQVVWQPWMVAWVNLSKKAAPTLPALPSEDERDADRERREQERAQWHNDAMDEEISERIYEEEAA